MNALKQQNSDLKLQLSALKLDLVSHGKPLNTYNPESQFIQDLRKKEVPGMKGVVSSSEGLHTKLLRAELLKYKGGKKSPSIEASQSSKDPQNVAQTSRSQLRGLEQLQYELTSKELQYAQRTLARNNDQHSLSPRKKNSASAQKLQKHSSNTELAEKAGLPESSTVRDDLVSPWQPSFSSDDRASLQDVWKLLDEDSPGLTHRRDKVSKSQLREVPQLRTVSRSKVSLVTCISSQSVPRLHCLSRQLGNKHPPR
ncbi:uncharacterized protein LOC114538619 [Dendronephthya gigantea]|uniref:uncharacterized protein LOC114538619 n=1 Tax=Dendronephthya gigantea TaxID=151771 RepID=UPI00106CEE73|nr:uncharacterized protein LOC114538619 [Dendronephthya gigantea]